MCIRDRIRAANIAALANVAQDFEKFPLIVLSPIFIWPLNNLADKTVARLIFPPLAPKRCLLRQVR